MTTKHPLKKLNITSRSKSITAHILSNLAHTPFSYGGYSFSCVEAALQGIKFANKNEREKVFAMKGLDALRSGRKITKSIRSNQKRYVYWNGKKTPYNSKDHRLLIAAFIAEKIRQNNRVQKALLRTRKFFIYHDAGEQEHPKTSLPERLFIEILIDQRNILMKLRDL